MSDSNFFAELQSEFLAEASHMLEQFEETMLSLENGNNQAEDLSQIFRVIHSVKGGAAAVGFTDLAQFAHIAEDLLSILRLEPDFMNAEIISILLKSGDAINRRITGLMNGETAPFETTDLQFELKRQLSLINGNESTASSPAKPEISEVPAASSGEDHTNYELLSELMSQMGEPLPEVQHVAAPVPSPQVSNSLNPPLAQEDPSPSEPQTKPEAAKVAAKVTQKPGGSIKVETAKLDNVLDAVGELVVLKNQILHNDAVKDGSNPQLLAVVDQIDKAVRDLYDKTLGMRMTPLKAMFQKIQRIVRDVSISLGKPVELILEGEDTEVDRSVFELLSDPLVHLVRNSMDHGIEKPELRKERKKPATAKVKVSARQTGGSVVIEISDDGGGINREKVLKKAIEKSLVPFGVDPQSIPDAQVYQYIFAPGFSTADKVSDLSGRGVGLDVVRSNVEKVHGKIDISSKANEGSSFKLTIPLSTAITDGIVVGIGQQQFIIPIHSIREIVRLSPSDYTRVSNHGTVVNVRDLVLPLIDLDQSLGQLNSFIAHERKLTQNSKASMVVVIESVTGMMAFPVDQVIGQSQVVVKSMSLTKEIAEISGAAIMGDGNTMLILDPQAIIQRHLDHNVSAA